jgi:hypothetical protein
MNQASRQDIKNPLTYQRVFHFGGEGKPNPLRKSPSAGDLSFQKFPNTVTDTVKNISFPLIAHLRIAITLAV